MCGCVFRLVVAAIGVIESVVVVVVVGARISEAQTRVSSLEVTTCLEEEDCC